MPPVTCFTDEILTAVDLLAGGLPVDAILTHRFAVNDAAAAFAVAGDRRAASKVLLDFTGEDSRVERSWEGRVR